jgi:hypothetical protein
LNESYYQFERELPAATMAEIMALQDDEYIIHKEWANGIELRKGKPFRDWLLALHVLMLVCFPILLIPGFMRSFINNIYGYKFRYFVTFDQPEPNVFLV